MNNHLNDNFRRKLDILIHEKERFEKFSEHLKLDEVGQTMTVYNIGHLPALALVSIGLSSFLTRFFDGVYHFSADTYIGIAALLSFGLMFSIFPLFLWHMKKGYPILRCIPFINKKVNRFIDKKNKIIHYFSKEQHLQELIDSKNQVLKSLDYHQIYNEQYYIALKKQLNALDEHIKKEDSYSIFLFSMQLKNTISQQLTLLNTDSLLELIKGNREKKEEEKEINSGIRNIKEQL